MNELLEEILGEVAGHPPAREVLESARGRTETRISVCEAAVPLMAAAAYRILGGPLVLAVPTDAARTAGDVAAFLPGEAFHLPGGALAGEWFRPSDETVGQRFRAAGALAAGQVVIAGVEALLGGVPSALPEGWPITLAAGEGVDLESLMERLVEGGYDREYTVEGWGRFALRGGILDIFPSTGERPVRVELVGETIESLREFNIVTQRSADHVERLEIFPAVETEGRVAQRVSRPTVLAVNPGMIAAKALEFLQDLGLEAREEPLLDSWGAVMGLDTLGGLESGGPTFPGGPVREFAGDLASAAAEWKRLVASGERVYLLLDGPGQVQRAGELWAEHGGAARPPAMGVGTLSRGFAVPDLGITVFTSSDLVGRPRARRAARRASSGAPVASYAELEVDGYVVQADEGIGIFRGLVSREVLGVTREYLLIEYADGDMLYVPTSQLPMVQRYVGSETPTVHRLRGAEWNRARAKARRSAEKTARELLQLYMERRTLEAFSFSDDTIWQAEMEASFEYEDTLDQARAVAEVKADMESERSMDRLICGDVGYGKTEVAVRAAMKAAMDSKQVAVLVPTTVLASQHFDTFRRRLAPFPVRVEMLSRFLSRAEQERVVDSVAQGGTDVVIGTHRLLQDDVAFRDLGLLVVDEEQRFGVAHKERLRRLSRNVDTLTLTATPIPRTLQMSLSGVRDVSIIDTPPEDRHPIATYVGETDPDLARRAINYEVARGGQVFYVHNRVQSIQRVADRLRGGMAGISVAVAHGQMDEDDLEEVMMEFADGLHDVLVCTTIIESGLDLPNVNTLIVDRADRLGLAQLYQIRGRVGRALRKAYAYLFYPHRSTLTDGAVARLSTIAEMTPLGSGMRVAMRDLEIRGAGNLLGAQQSGHIEAVGFEMYCQLLKEAVDILKGEPPPETNPAMVSLPVEAYIPAQYVSDQEARVEIYRRILVAGRADTLDELEADLEDRFGEIPVEVCRMLQVEGMRYRAGTLSIESITMRKDELVLKAPGKALKALQRSAGNVSVRGIGTETTFKDAASETLYFKLRFDEGNNRQELLLMWLKSIIDDTMIGQRSGSGAFPP